MKYLNFMLVIVLLLSLSCSNSDSTLGIVGKESNAEDVFYKTKETAYTESVDDAIEAEVTEEMGEWNFGDGQPEVSTSAFSGSNESSKPEALLSSRYENQKSNIELKIIKEADIKIEVEEYAKALSTIKEIIKKHDAYISNEQENAYSYALEADLTIRINNKDFEKVVQNIASLAGKVEYKNISSKDVTEEFVDLQSRIRTKKEVEKRYYQILSKAKNVEEILQVEGQLRIIREEIEAKQGRLNYLSNQVSYSTINLELYQPLDPKYEPAKSPNFFNRIAKAFSLGWKGVVNFVIGLIYVWPLLVVIVVIYYLARKVVRKRKNKNS